MAERPPEFWRVLGYRDGEPVSHVYEPSEGVEFDEVVVGDWLHVEQLDEQDYHVTLGGQHFNVRRWKTKPVEVTFLFDDGYDGG